MPETITSYPVFAAGGRARAGEVNNNFGNHRGTNLPIDPNTAVAVDATYNLGSTEYGWQGGHINNLFLGQATSTTDVVIKGDTGSTAGNIQFEIGSTVVSNIDNNGIARSGLQEPMTPIFTDATTLAFGAASTGGILFLDTTIPATPALSTRHVEISLISAVTTAGSRVSLNHATTTAEKISAILVRNAVTIGVIDLFELDNQTSGSSVSAGLRNPNARFIDTSVTSAAREYSIHVSKTTFGSGDNCTFANVRMMIREL